MSSEEVSTENSKIVVPKTSPRVFHRGKGTLVLLWEKVPGTDPTSAILYVKSLTNKDDSRERALPLESITFNGDFKKRIQSRLDESTVVCEVNEELAQMSRWDDYYVRIKQGDVIQGVRVYRAGVKRPFEGEADEKNVHLHAWDRNRLKWRKVDGVQLSNGRFGLLTVSVPSTCDQCGYTPGEEPK